MSLNKDRDVLKDSLNSIFTKTEVKQGSYVQQLRSKYGFHAIHNQIMTQIMNTVIVWILSCFTKYSPEQFHSKMGGFYGYQDKKTGLNYQLSGFDFITDWETNHNYRYNQLLKFIRKVGSQIDRAALLEATIKSLNSHGWQVTPHEIEGFQQTIQRLYNILYFNVDSLA